MSVRLWVSESIPHIAIFAIAMRTSRDSLMRVLLDTCQMHAPTVPNDQSPDHAIADHVIMTKRKCFVVYLREAQSKALCAANAVRS